jgi:hypothetical protein
MAKISEADRARRSEQMKKLAADKKAAKAAELLKEPVEETQPAAKVVKTERKRKSAFTGMNMRLGVLGEIPGYKLHWFNDIPGRISQAQQTGYDFVLKGEVDLAMSGIAVNANEDLGGRISTFVDKGDSNTQGGFRAYLMKIPLEYFEEDQKDMQDKINQVEQDMIRHNGVAGGLSGKDTYGKGLEIKHSFKNI